ncbi:transcription activator of gluconeogenesis ERT1 [Armillaria mellea]|nr:transcription activator of gluconeogenesis ERT1 [Armillaria mellea]
MIPIAPAPPAPSVPSYINPSQIDINDDKARRAPKRKRTDTPDESGTDAPARNTPRHGPKKKKANRACFHCQKAHLTCDDARPCQRCTKRGIANSCTEGHRKKAKYLLDDEELNELRRSKDPTTDKTVDAPAVEEITEPVFVPSFDPNFPFGSEAANLEYSILSAILGNPSPPDSANTPPPDFWPSVPYNPPFVTYPYQSADETVPPPPSSSAAPDPEPPSAQDPPLHPLAPRYPLDSRPRSPPLFLSDAHDQPTSNLQTINDRITKPYDYTEGYHFLMKHLPTRFEKNDILRIVRALAIFRPSLIALQMPLSLDDEVFVEKCFQRSLLELDKLMSFSGTPTVVWRRTGEICLVAPEFCMLTEWAMEDLVGPGKRKYIYELFENQSVVEYWENFASHAFENTTQSVYSHCVLLKPSGAPVPSTFCFSIRRDLFDLPSVVIGQWLPLL